MAEVTNASAAVVADDFEKFAELSNQREMAEKLGKRAPEPKLEAEPAVVEPEPVKEEPKVEEHKPKSPGSLSYRELRNRVRELETELRVRKEVVREEPQPPEEPAPVEAKPEQQRKRPKTDDKNERGEAKYKTWEEYEDDLLAWNKEEVLRTLDERSSQRTQEQQIQAMNKTIEDTWRERCEQARKAHEDFDDCLSLETGPGKLIQPGSLVDEWVMDSEHGAELLYFFHHNPNELLKFERIEGKTPGERRARARRMLMAIETNFEKPSAPQKKEPEVRTTRVTRPSTEIGGRGAAPVDRVRAAVANDDTGDYIEQMNRREIREKFGDYRR